MINIGNASHYKVRLKKGRILDKMDPKSHPNDKYVQNHEDLMTKSKITRALSRQSRPHPSTPSVGCISGVFSPTPLAASWRCSQVPTLPLQLGCEALPPPLTIPFIKSTDSTQWIFGKFQRMKTRS